MSKYTFILPIDSTPNPFQKATGLILNYYGLKAAPSNGATYHKYNDGNYCCITDVGHDTTSYGGNGWLIDVIKMLKSRL